MLLVRPGAPLGRTRHVIYNYCNFPTQFGHGLWGKGYLGTHFFLRALDLERR